MYMFAQSTSTLDTNIKSKRDVFGKQRFQGRCFKCTIITDSLTTPRRHCNVTSVPYGSLPRKTKTHRLFDTELTKVQASPFYEAGSEKLASYETLQQRALGRASDFPSRATGEQSSPEPSALLRFSTHLKSGRTSHSTGRLLRH